jgi:histidyl-tRNA synthetase
MLYFKDPCRGTRKIGKYHRYADLEIIGSSGSIAEATLIQAGRAMLAEEGYTKTIVEINSVGDKDSIARFTRELVNYYRKNINEMSPECRQMFKRDAFELLGSHDESCKELNARAPRSMDFLTEVSRRHLEEVLEYLEALQVPYTLNNALIGNRKYCTETIFAIVNADAEDKTVKDQRILGIGVRYNGLAKRLNSKRDIQGVGLSLLIKENGHGLRKPVTKIKRPIASFIQLGLESKLLSLGIIEQLRLAKIPLYLSLAKDRLGAQVSTIEKYHTPYMIVMGKKEAVDKTVIVRRTDTHSQDIVPLSELAKYMKKVEALWLKK